MKLLNRSLHAAAATLVTVSVAGILLLSSCDESEVGVQCAITEGADAGPSNESSVQLNTRSFDCESKLCILYGIENPLDAESTCTKGCNTDEDCPIEALGACRNETDQPRAFVCRIGSSVTPTLAKCCKMCVCADWVVAEEDPQSLACEDADTSSCSTFK